MKMASRVVSSTQIAGRGTSATDGPGRIYRHGVTKQGPDEGVDVGSFVAETAERMHKQLAVERVEAPTAALEYAPRLAQHGVPACAA
jgi:hypothetical protein